MLLDKIEIKKILDPIVWKIMVGCATGRTEPNEKDDFVNQIATAVDNLIKEKEKNGN